MATVRAPDSCCIDHIEAVEPYRTRTLQEARTNQIGLMCLVWQKRRQHGIYRALGFMLACSPMSRVVTTQDPVDGSD
jgi:hypothetical protein